MKTRAIVGIIACLVGLLWIVQGLSSTKGSGMTGHKQYSVLGLVVLLAGIALLVWAWRLFSASRQSRQD